MELIIHSEGVLKLWLFSPRITSPVAVNWRYQYLFFKISSPRDMMLSHQYVIVAPPEIR